MTHNCKKWLYEFLRRNLGYASVEDVRMAAKVQGYSRAELKAARKELEVKTHHQFHLGWDTGNYFWYLPEMSGKFE